MKSQFVIVVLKIVIALCFGLSNLSIAVAIAEEANPFQEWEIQKKPLKKSKPAKAHPVFGWLKPIGDVFAELTGTGGGNAPAAPVGPVEADLAPRERHLDPHDPHIQILKLELRFVRTVCQPTPEQYKTIKKAGDVGLKAAVKEYESMLRGQRLEYPNPIKTITEELARSVQQTLPTEKAQRYQLELAKRAAARKRATVLNLVVALDKELVLSAVQRTQLIDQLNANWKDIWGDQLEGFLHVGPYEPVLTDNVVLPVLNETQKEIWRGMPKHRNVGWLGLAFVEPGELADEVEVPEVVEDKP
jgi:hypothetical protein